MNFFGKKGEHNSDYSLSVSKLDHFSSPFEIFKKLYAVYDRAFIFESLVGPKELSEISIIGFDPDFIVKCSLTKFSVYDRKRKIYDQKVDDPLVQLRKLLPKIDNDRFRFIGGAVGYVGYDAIRFWENLPARKNKRTFPVMEFGIYNDGIIYKHDENQAYYFCVGRESRAEQIQKKIASGEKTVQEGGFIFTPPKRNLSKSHFVRMVKKSKKYIYDGDIFQVVLSKSIKFKINGDLLHVYSSLRDINPSPYMYMLKMRNRCIIGSSPEMLIRVTKDYVETFPIAGTRQVVEDESENKRLEKDLLNDEKEIAEHTMLVDLARNDVGRVCKFGSVRVHDLMKVKRFSHVQHLVSHVTGRLQNNYDCYDAFRAVFPAGTVSGAPKVRAMEIIDELEPEYREPYAGAIGYFSFNGSCDFAITIRSLFINKKNAYIQSGAGIVMDSDPEKEWFETEHKANAILSALEAGKKVDKKVDKEMVRRVDGRMNGRTGRKNLGK